MEIDPGETEVVGYESPACLEILISLMIGRIKGDSIPKVKLYTFDNGQTYQIPYPWNQMGADAGHHRTLAAILLGDGLEIEVVESIDETNIKMEIPIDKRISINHMRVESNPKNFHYERDDMGKYYRELPSADEFFSQYGKINLALKHGTHTDYSLQRSDYEHILSQVQPPS